ncbi:flavoprotein [Herbidospora mongoliensis]|uniref:flavoprotein n=1 Tax=Herbidospora mongoliensis TaxID=688067 RepID=UPI000833D31F|nr:flavoprotein [Herbidospora mongoliensis]
MTDLAAALNAPAFSSERLLVMITGSLNATFMPYWVNWLQLSYPKLEIQVVVTRSAERFVTRHALAVMLNKDVPLDAWPDDPVPGSPHVHYATWPDTVLVYPATYNFLSRFAGGLADTPMLLALQTTKARIGIGPALPPGATESHAYRQNLTALQARPNVVIGDPIRGFSAHTREWTAASPPPLPVLIEQLEAWR